MRKIQVIPTKPREVEKAYVFQPENLPHPVRRRLRPVHLRHLRQAGRRSLRRHRLLSPLPGRSCAAPVPAVPKGGTGRSARAERRTVEKNHRSRPVLGAALRDVVRVPALYLHRQLHRPGLPATPVLPGAGTHPFEKQAQTHRRLRLFHRTYGKERLWAASSSDSATFR